MSEIDASRNGAGKVGDMLEHADPVCCPVVELRQYTLKPGRRDDLITLFERYFLEGQEQYGMQILGQFRRRTDPDHFVWLSICKSDTWPSRGSIVVPSGKNIAPQPMPPCWIQTTSCYSNRHASPPGCIAISRVAPPWIRKKRRGHCDRDHLWVR